MKASIQEIFCSVQGEGPFAGVKQIFVRFFGCDVSCDWCDTPAAQGGPARDVRELDAEQIFLEVMGQWENCHSVSLTGGEPLLQTAAIAALLPKFRQAELPVYLDSNGIHVRELKEVIFGIDYVAMDIKLPSSTLCRGYWQEHEEFLRVAVQEGRGHVFVKAVISANTVKEDVVQAVALLDRVDVEVPLVLQPNTREDAGEVIAKCLAYQDYGLNHLADVRVLPQWHALLGVR